MVLVTKPHNKTPYELLICKAPIISFMRPFGYPVTIFNTLDHLGKFDGKADEGFLAGYSINTKAFRVYNSKTKKVEEDLHVKFLENKPNVAGSGPEWLFDIDSLTNSMNYQPLSAGNRTNGITGSKIYFDAGQEGKEKVSDQEYIILPMLNTRGKIDDLGCLDQQMKSTNDSKNTNSTNSFNTASPTVNTASDKDGTFQRTYGEWNFSTPITVNAVDSSFSHPGALDKFSKMTNLEDTRIFDDAYDDRDEGADADYNNLETVYKNKRDQRGIVVRNKAWLVAQGHKQEEEEVYVSQPSGFMDPVFPDKVYKVEKALYGLYQAPRAYDIIFGSTKRSLSIEFEKLMHNRFQMSSMGELTFFIGLQECKKQTIVANSTTAAEYIAASNCCGQVLWLQNQLLDYGYNFMQTKIHVDNESAICVVKNLVYHLKTKHIKIRHHFIRDTYEKRFIEMVKIHTDSNVADLLTKAFDVTRFQFLVASIGQTTTGKEFLNPLMAGSLPKTISAKEKSDDNTEFHQIVDFHSLCSITYALIKIHAIVDGKAVIILESLVRSDLLSDDEDGNVTPLFDTMLVQHQEPEGEDTSGSPRCQETIGGTSAQTWFKRVLEQPNEPPLTKGHTSRSREGRLEENIELADIVPIPYDSPLTGGYTPGSDEGRITLAKLMETYATLSKRVTQLEKEFSTTKVVYNKAFITLTNRVKKDDDDDETLTETLLNIKRSSAKDKGKGIMQETELPKKLKKKEMIQLSLDEELAQKFYARELAKEGARQEQERYNLEKALELQRQLDQKKENVPKGDQAKEIDWNDPQVLRYHALKNRPFSKAKVKKNMIMYLKNQGGYKQSYFKGMKYENIKPLFERIWDQVHTFVPKDFKIEREVMKRAGFDPQQGSLKKQRLDQQTEETKEEAKAQVDSDQEVEELKIYIRLIPKEDIAIEAIPLAIKPPVIIEYKIVKEGKISTYHITRADGSIRRYTSMINLLENIDKEDLETLWKLVKDKYGCVIANALNTSIGFGNPVRGMNPNVTKDEGNDGVEVSCLRWPPRVTLGRLLPHARGLGFKPRRGGFPSGAKKEWGLSPKAKVRVLHTAQLDVTNSGKDEGTSFAFDFTLPCDLRTSPGVPAHFDNQNMTLL
uniref:Putative ribonuclease H-like domain-containing protein n=1 Tax=Tanacetum cinerariifolium TaxID=118510 RepID=A0A6L2LV98_TANCI|nr:putative ribonuclease H-like domain-containing protein [Tanacetum cinerariifolium]